MNETLQVFLNKSLEYLNSAEAFLGKEIPLYVQELLAYEAYQAIGGIFLSIILMIGSVYATKQLLKSRDIEFLAIFSCALGLVMILMLCSNTLTLIKIKVAPRVFLIDRISETISNRK